MKRSIFYFVSVSLTISCIGAVSPSKEVEEAIDRHQPERLLKLCPQDLADLMQNREKYIKKAKENTAKVWDELHTRFDSKDKARMVTGLATVGLSGWLLYGFLYPALRELLQKPEGEHKAFSLDKQKILYTLMGSAAGSLLAGIGFLNMYKGFKKHDRLKKYYDALAIESNLNNWLALKLN